MTVIGTVGAGRFQRDAVTWCEAAIPKALKIIQEFNFRNNSRKLRRNALNFRATYNTYVIWVVPRISSHVY